MKDLLAQEHHAAGNGLLDRRLFLKKGLLFTTASSIAASSLAADHTTSEQGQPTQNREKIPARTDAMNRPGAPFSTYGKPSPYESEVVRFPSANQVLDGNGVSWTPLHELEGTITPNGLHYERHHNGVPDIDPAAHQLVIHGLVEKALKFSVKDLLRYPMQSKICFIECGGNSNAGYNTQPSRSNAGYFHGLVSNTEWTGIPLSVLMHEAGIQAEASWLIAEGADAFAMNISIPMEKIMDDALLGLYQNGERLRPENGYPMRLVLPGWEGVMNVKWVRRLEITDHPVMARNETSKYTELQKDGKARMFTHVMEAKSLILSPSGGMYLKEPGLYQITGLAWTGHGKIKKVEVSADGGKTWAEADLQGPILDRAFTRFRMPWLWQGQTATLKSRVTDETGYVQPERSELIKQRGRHGFFHYNAIVSWEVDADGAVTQTYDQTTDYDETDNLSIDTGWD